MDKEVIKSDDLHNANSKLEWMKLLSGKSIKIIVLSILAIVAVVIFINFGNESRVTSKSEDVIPFEYQTTMKYCSDLESKLVAILSQIKGAGNVSVMLSVDGSPELIYAMDSDSKVSSNSSGSTTTNSSTPIIVQTSSGSSPLVLSENLPIVKGVIVVSSGANDIAIKLDILNAVSTLLDISTDKIRVLKGL